MNTNSALSTWTTANNLHSDSISEFLISGNQLLMASKDNGLARYDWSSGFWLSTWSSSNWLNSNYIGDLVLSNNILYILSGDALHSYNTANGIFQQTYQLSDFGLNGDVGDDLILWPNILEIILLTILKKPYDNQNNIEEYQAPAPLSNEKYQTFCGT